MITYKDILSDKPHEECGVFGVYNNPNATQITYYGLHSLQHRGQEGVGIAVLKNGNILSRKGEGLVTEIIKPEHIVKLQSDFAIGHVRYSTTGGSGLDNVQPITIRSKNGNFAVCHNGNIVNGDELKTDLESKGSIFQCTSDSEIIAHLIQREQGSFDERLHGALNKLEGAFAFLILTSNAMYVIRDKNGLRPISIATLQDSFVISSETCAFSVTGATFLRDVRPGEIIKIFNNKISSSFYTTNTQKKLCAMEYIYFSRPDSDLEGINVHTARKNTGKILAQENPICADVVIGIPDSSLSAAMGYAEMLNIPYEMGLVKNKYVGRTFIQPTQELRVQSVNLKLSVVQSIVKDKRVVLIDDSIVRGTTIKLIVKMIKKAGAKEVHICIASPTIISSCFYGVDTSKQSELIGSLANVEEMKNIIGVDSLYFISKEGLFKAIGRDTMCTACFDKMYPTSLFSLQKLIYPILHEEV